MDTPTPVTTNAARRRWRPTALALAGGLGLSLVLFVLVRDKESERMEADFTHRAGIPAAALQRDIDDHLYILRSLGYFFFSSVEVDRGEFRSFTKVDLARLAGFEALEWLPRVPASTRERFEKQAGPEARKYKALSDQFEALDQFRLSGWDGQREELFPICFVEPSAGNLATLGLDLVSDPDGRAAMDLARETGQPAATAPSVSAPGHAGPLIARVFTPIYMEIMYTDGVQYVGALPGEYALATGYSAALVGSAKGHSLLSALVAADNVALRFRAGFE